MGIVVTFYGTKNANPCVGEFLSCFLDEAGSLRALAGSFDDDREFRRRPVKAEELLLDNQIMLKLGNDDEGILDLTVRRWDKDEHVDDYEDLDLNRKPPASDIAVVADLEPYNGPTSTAYTDLVDHVLVALEETFGPGFAAWDGDEALFTKDLKNRLDSHAQLGLQFDVKLVGDRPRVEFMTRYLRENGPRWLAGHIKAEESALLVTGDAGTVTNASRDNAWRALLHASQYAIDGHVRFHEDGKWHDVVSAVGGTTLELPEDVSSGAQPAGLWSAFKSIFSR